MSQAAKFFSAMYIHRYVLKFITCLCTYAIVSYLLKTMKLFIIKLNTAWVYRVDYKADAVKGVRNM